MSQVENSKVNAYVVLSSEPDTKIMTSKVNAYVVMLRKPKGKTITPFHPET